MKGEIFKGDPYNGLCISIIETAEHLYMIQDYCIQPESSTGHE